MSNIVRMTLLVAIAAGFGCKPRNQASSLEDVDVNRCRCSALWSCKENSEISAVKPIESTAAFADPKLCLADLYTQLRDKVGTCKNYIIDDGDFYPDCKDVTEFTCGSGEGLEICNALQLVSQKFSRIRGDAQEREQAIIEYIYASGDLVKSFRKTQHSITQSGNRIGKDIVDLGLQVQKTIRTRIAVPDKWRETEKKASLQVIWVSDNLAYLYQKQRKSELPPDPYRLGLNYSLHELGIRVGDVMKGSLAEKAGIQPGDILIRCNGELLVAPNALLSLKIINQVRGDDLTIEGLRAGESVRFVISAKGPK